MPGNGRPRDTSVQSVDRAVSILQVLARRGSAGVTEIAEELGVHKSTAFRLLATLDARGLVEQDGDRGRYRVGYTAVEIAAGVQRRNDLSLLSQPACQALAESVGETVNLVIHDGPEVISLDQWFGGTAMTNVDWVGKHTPIHATAAGKIFLAFMPPDRADELLVRDLERYTPQTIVDPVRLKEQLALIRKQDYSSTVDEYEIGLAVVAAPIRALDGEVVAAVCAAGPTFRVNEDTIPRLAEQVMATAAQISWRKGHPKRG